MIQKEHKKILLIMSLFLAILVFIGGLAVGWSLDHIKTDDISESLRKGELDIESLIVEKDYLDLIGGSSCDVLEGRLEKLRTSSGELGRTIELYESSSTFMGKDYKYLNRKHMILKTRIYLALKDLEKECNREYPIILYFYETNHNTCLRQGEVLNQLNEKENNSLNILAFDLSLAEEEPLILLMKEQYRINTVPSLIVNEKTKLEGLTFEQEIREALGLY